MAEQLHIKIDASEVLETLRRGIEARANRLAERDTARFRRELGELFNEFFLFGFGPTEEYEALAEAAAKRFREVAVKDAMAEILFDADGL